MNKAAVKKSIKNLRKIKGIIEVSKFDTLQKLQKATQVSDAFFKMAISAKNLVEFAREQYHIVGKKNKDNNKTLWIYLTPEAEIMSISNAKFDKMIRNEFNPSDDSIIAIGDKAVSFAEKENYNSIYSNRELGDSTNSIASLIYTLVMSGEISRVRVVMNSPKVADGPITIFPINELNLRGESGVTIDKSYKFFPSISDAITSLMELYIHRVFFSFIKEMQYFHLKEKLIRHEGSITSVDQKIEEKTRELNKLNRKKETEELILVSQIARGDDA